MLCLETHCVAACIGALNNRLAVKAEAIFGVELIAYLDLVVLYGLLLAVIGLGVGVARNRHGDLIGYRSDLELTGGELDLVVTGLGVILERIGEGVVAFSCVGLSAGHGIRCALALNKAIACYGDSAVRERLAVIGLLGVCAGHDDTARRDGKSAVFECCLAVACGNIDIAVHDLVRLNDVRCLACVCYRAFNDRFDRVALVELSDIGEAGLGKRFAVVGLSCIICGYDQGVERGDPEPAVGDHKLNVCEVLGVLVAEMLGLEIHIVRSGGDTRCGCAVGLCEVDLAFGVKRIIAIEGVTRNGLSCAVIGLRAGVTRNRHGDLSGYGINGELAGSLRDCVVFGHIGAVCVLNDDRAAECAVILACIGALCGIGQSLIGVTLEETRRGDAGDGLLAAGVSNGIALAGEGDSYCGLVDCELADLGLYIVVIGDIIAGCVLNDCRAAEFAVILADIGALCGIGQSLIGVTLKETRRGDAGDGLLAAGVSNGIALAGESRVYLIDGKAAVGDHELNVCEVRARVRKPLCLETHCVGACIGAMGYGITIIVEAICSVERIVGFKLIACNGLLAAIVRNGVLIARNRDNNCVDRSDYELAVVCFGYDVLSGSINGAYGAVCKFCIILADLGALSADGEVKACVCIGAVKAAYAVLFAVICDCITLCGNGNIFIVVEVDHIAGGGDGDGSVLVCKRSVAVNGNGSLGDLRVESLTAHGLGLSHGCFRSVEVVVNGVLELVALCPCTDEFNIVIGHCERAVGVNCDIIGSPAAELITGHAGNGCRVNCCALSVIRRFGKLVVCTLGDEASFVGIAYIVDGCLSANAGNGEVDALINAVCILVVQGGNAVGGIVFIIDKAFLSGVELYGIAHAVGVGGLITVSSYNGIGKSPRIAVCRGCIRLGNARHLDKFGLGVVDDHSGGDAIDYRLGYCGERRVQSVGIIGIVCLVRACCYVVSKELGDLDFADIAIILVGLISRVGVLGCAEAYGVKVSAGILQSCCCLLSIVACNRAAIGAVIRFAVSVNGRHTVGEQDGILGLKILNGVAAEQRSRLPEGCICVSAAIG